MSKITAKDISRIIVERSQRFGLRGSNVFFLMENVSWGLFHWGEVDLLVCSKANYLTDIEVKISISDLKADFKKSKWNKESRDGKKFLKDIKYHYYAIPEELLARARVIVEQYRPESGIIVIKRVLRGSEGSEFYSEGCSILKPAKANKLAKPLPANKLMNLARLSMFRYWRNSQCAG